MDSLCIDMPTKFGMGEDTLASIDDLGSFVKEIDDSFYEFDIDSIFNDDSTPVHHQGSSETRKNQFQMMHSSLHSSMNTMNAVNTNYSVLLAGQMESQPSSLSFNMPVNKIDRTLPLGSFLLSSRSLEKSNGCDKSIGHSELKHGNGTGENQYQHDPASSKVHPQENVCESNIETEQKGNLVNCVAEATCSNIDTIFPSENDVLLGRGGRNNQWSGNEKLRHLASAMSAAYSIAAKRNKPAIAWTLVLKMRALQPPTRFLKQDQCSGSWHEVNDDVAREKASQCLRDIVASRAKVSSVFGSEVQKKNNQVAKRSSAPEMSSIHTSESFSKRPKNTTSQECGVNASFPIMRMNHSMSTGKQDGTSSLVPSYSLPQLNVGPQHNYRSNPMQNSNFGIDTTTNFMSNNIASNREALELLEMELNETGEDGVGIIASTSQFSSLSQFLLNQNRMN